MLHVSKIVAVEDGVFVGIWQLKQLDSLIHWKNPIVDVSTVHCIRFKRVG